MNELSIPAKALPVIPTSTVPAVAEALDRYATHAKGAFSANTERAIRSDVGVFTAWCIAHEVTPCPASPEVVAEFLREAASSRKPTTVRRYAASLAHLHRAAGLDNPCRDEVVRLALRAIGKDAASRAAEESRPVREQAEGLTETDLAAIVATCTESRRDMRDKALALVGKAILARRSELVALKVADLVENGDGTGTITIRRSKTDQAGEGAEQHVPAVALDALLAWLGAAGITAGWLFRSIRKGDHVADRPLPADEVSVVLKRLAGRARLRPERVARVSGHSLRVGMAQDLVAAGAGLPEVMQAGRWSSSTMPAHYARRAAAGRGAVAKFYAKG
jgi:integrase